MLPTRADGIRPCNPKGGIRPAVAPQGGEGTFDKKITKLRRVS